MKNIKKMVFGIILMFFSTYNVLADTLNLKELGFGNGGFGPLGQTCSKVLGATVVKIIHGSVGILRIAAVIIAILSAMFTLMGAVVSKDADGLKKAEKKCVIMGIVLLGIGIFPSVVTLIASVFGFDTTCIF